MAGRKTQDTTAILKMKFIFRTPACHRGLQSRFFMGSLAEVPISTVRSSLPRLLLWLVAVLLLLVLGLGGYAFYIAESALPRMDGRLQVRGLTAPVTVTRDSHGVPTIDAASLPDLFFAQGYVTAQDRMWQMDVMRRLGSGELSEVLGPGTLKVDREQKILGLRAAAAKSLQMATARDHTFFEAYARGVNAYIAEH